MPAWANGETERSTVESVKKLLEDKSKTAEVRLAEAQKVLASSLGGSAGFKQNLFQSIAAFQRQQGNSEGALSTLNQGIEQLGTAEERFFLVAEKIELLNRLDVDQSVVFGREQWQQVQPFRSKRSNLARPYLRALRLRGDDEDAKKFLLSLWSENLSEIAGYGFGWLPGEMVTLMSSEGKDSEALSYAKLGWMLARFEDGSLSETTKILAKAWLPQDPEGLKLAAFLKAQTDAKAPNPLKDVALPALASELLKAQTSAARDLDGRITMLLIAGQWRKAMLAARAEMIDRPDSSDGVRQVCRVFKAADLNLVRANAFVEWMKKPQGPNPVAGFLQEYPAPTS